ncbi:MAG TPA: NAD(P)-dependent oxidoreductase [Gammaproteobacteria bacterium]|nr:NAD(P)-dependent oxidoreductase [Gammaproteobacteria bacterium]
MSNKVGLSEDQPLGFIGLGVMGEPMCRNLALCSGRSVIAFDQDSAPLNRLAKIGVLAAKTVQEVGAAEIVFLSLPHGDAVSAVCLGKEGLLLQLDAGSTLVDLGTSPVALTREIALLAMERSVAFADAPVARTRAAAEAGTLSIMVGAAASIYTRLEPLLRHMGEDITHCGDVGAGQTVKIMNNMVLFQTVSALAEALHIARRSGVDPQVLFETLAKGSADSFALRNHGMKALLPEIFPTLAFSARYALKDNDYALALAEVAGVKAEGAELVARRLQETIDAGYGDDYFPVLSRLLG